MNYDLKMIKKYYGEEMSRLCRTLFPTILEKEGLLFELISNNFEYNHELYNDIMNNCEYDIFGFMENRNSISSFKNYIYNLVSDKQIYNKEEVIKTPSELLSEAGYYLYECKSEKDIQSFKKYYCQNEKLCTFNGGRLKDCYVFFAVKKNVDEIKRKNFPNPKRQDEYGTSVISIQFTRDKNHTLSIKNRYNHRVSNPDTTFSNNLDNIIEGLTKSFEKYYGLKQVHMNTLFEIPNYVKANDGKYYKYNYEINNIYYCTSNVIIDNFEVKKYNKDRYLILDYFILDLKEKTLKLYDQSINDGLIKSIIEIDKIDIIKEKNRKIIKLKQKNGDNLEIQLDGNNNICGINAFDLKVMFNRFLIYNEKLKFIMCPNIEIIENKCLKNNKKLENLNFPKLKQIGKCFLNVNRVLKNFNAPNLEIINCDCINNNINLKKLNLPSVRFIGSGFLSLNKYLEEFNAPKLEVVKCDCMNNNINLKKLNLPSVRFIGSGFLRVNKCLEEFNAPKLEVIEDNCLYFNCSIKIINLENLKKVGSSFLYGDYKLEVLNAPKLETIDIWSFRNATRLQFLNLPKLKEIGEGSFVLNGLVDDILENGVSLERFKIRRKILKLKKETSKCSLY